LDVRLFGNRVFALIDKLAQTVSLGMTGSNLLWERWCRRLNSAGIEGKEMLARLFVAATASLMMIVTAQAQDGARAFHLVPADTNIVSLTSTTVHTEIGAGEFDAVTLTPSYRRSIDIMGNAGTFLIGVPVGDLSAGLNTPFGVIDIDSDIALGDLFVGGSLGLVGSPTLSPLDYAQYKPGFRVVAAAKLFLPTGSYDSASILNLGGNRWSLQASLPISYVLGDTMIDPDLTTIEIVPMVQFFGDNNDAFGPTSVLSQDPLFRLEGHLTRNFGQSIWASLDGAFEYGGQVSADDVPLGSPEESVSLGATLGWSPNASLSFRVSYEEVVSSNIPDFVDRNVKAVAAYRF
jgi:hypothetical protein